VQLRGHSLLDDPAERYYYLGVRSALAGRWLLLSLRIDGTLAAYALCLRDGDSLRVWDNKMSPGYARFSPGLLANMALVRCASADGQIALVDWGPGMQRYKASLSNDLIPSQTLTAWSSQLFRRTLSGAQHVKQLAHRRWPARSCRMVSRA
jgi:CelD/BcsL family acetyltransferase involved in cellulose biosynthesis